MKRRNFISLIGAAVTAPLLPRPVFAAPLAPAVVPRAYPYGLAVFHARTKSTVTAAHLAKHVQVSPAKAEQMIARMLRENHIVAGATSGTYSAADPYRQNPAVKARARSNAQARKVARTTANADPSMLVYLRDMANAYFATKVPV